MKPSERIDQLAQPLIEALLQRTREGLEKLEGGPVSDKVWAEYRTLEPLADALKQMGLNAKLLALIQYLDEQAEAEEPKPVEPPP